MSDRVVIPAGQDELAARLRALEAERLRPVPPPPRTNPRINLHALAELVDALGEEDDDAAGDGARGGA